MNEVVDESREKEIAKYEMLKKKWTWVEEAGWEWDQRRGQVGMGLGTLRCPLLYKYRMQQILDAWGRMSDAG